jgi:hypothetical protein
MQKQADRQTDRRTETEVHTSTDTFVVDSIDESRSQTVSHEADNKVTVSKKERSKLHLTIHVLGNFTCFWSSAVASSS